MTPADTLRAAADKLRSAAQDAVQDDRIRYDTGHTLGSKTPVVVDDHERPTVLIEVWAKNREQVNDYLALLGPSTGTAIADWLGQAARNYDASVTAAHRTWPSSDDAEARDRWLTGMADQHALAVARAILGEVAE